MSGHEREFDPFEMPIPSDRTRNQSPGSGDVKSTRFPRTTRRQDRVDAVLARRQPSLRIVLEDVHDPHNVAAVLRSCDAVGVLNVHLVYVHDVPPMKAFNRATSASAAKWVRTRFHDSIEECFDELRASRCAIYTTALREDTRDLYRIDFTEPTAIVFGNEKRGATNKAVELADGTVGIPMQGMVESLNISVACAVTLYEAMRQRRVAGMYAQPQLAPDELDALSAEWIRK